MNRFKRLSFKAGAVLIAVSVFFNSFFIQPVYASVTVGYIVQNVLWCIFGYGFSKGADAICEELGWSDSDINTDAEGNVIISESQINEIKEAFENSVLQEHGAYMYTGTAPNTYKDALSACKYSSEGSFNAGNPSTLTDYFWFSGTYPCQYWAPSDYHLNRKNKHYNH